MDKNFAAVKITPFSFTVDKQVESSRSWVWTWPLAASVQEHREMCLPLRAASCQGHVSTALVLSLSLSLLLPQLWVSQQNSALLLRPWAPSPCVQRGLALWELSKEPYGFGIAASHWSTASNTSSTGATEESWLLPQQSTSQGNRLHEGNMHLPRSFGKIC